MKAADPTAVRSTGTVGNIRPALLRDVDAATYLGHRASWLRALRLEDAKALREGGAPRGPRWLVLGGKSIRYRVEELDAWIAANAEDLGQVGFSNRGGRG